MVTEKESELERPRSILRSEAWFKGVLGWGRARSQTIHSHRPVCGVCAVGARSRRCQSEGIHQERLCSRALARGSTLCGRHVGEARAGGRGGRLGPCYSWRTLLSSQHEAGEPLGIAAGLGTHMALAAISSSCPPAAMGGTGLA